MTCHKAQGATVDVALLYGTAGLTREAGYVALSRGRTANHLYVADDPTSGTAPVEQGHLDELAARLPGGAPRPSPPASCPAPSPAAGRPADHPTLPRRIEGISR